MNKQASHLLDEAPISLYPTLAKLLGINRAVMFQQLHFLLNTTKAAKNKYNYIDGRWWVYNSYAEWQRDYFCWLSSSAIKRLFLEMEKDGIVLSRQGVKNPTDRRKWYTIDYEAWEKFIGKAPLKQADASAQFETPIGSFLSDGGSAQNEPLSGLKEADDLSETTTEITTDTTATTSEIKTLSFSPSPKLRFRFDWSIVQDPDGFARYANGKYIDKMSPEFPLAVQAIFEAWLSTLKGLNRAPMASDEDLWEQNRSAAIAMAKFHTQAAVVVQYITEQYTEPDSFWSKLASPMKLSSVANGLPSWNQVKTQKKTDAPEQDGRRYISGKYADYIEH